MQCVMAVCTLVMPQCTGQHRMSTNTAIEKGRLVFQQGAGKALAHRLSMCKGPEAEGAQQVQGCGGWHFESWVQADRR